MRHFYVFCNRPFHNLLCCYEDKRAVHAYTYTSHAMNYATPAWYSFTTAAGRGRLDSFLRRFVKLMHHDASSPSFDSLCERADG